MAQTVASNIQCVMPHPGCTLDLTLADFGSCADLSAAAEAVLRPGDNTTYAGINMVARWGSSDRAVLGDWVEIEEEAVPSVRGVAHGIACLIGWVVSSVRVGSWLDRWFVWVVPGMLFRRGTQQRCSNCGPARGKGGGGWRETRR